MAPLLSRRLLLTAGSAAVAATAMPAAALANRGRRFGRYGSPDDRLTADTLYVDAGGRGDHATVQAAVDAAAPGATLVIAAGTYRELVHVASAKTDLTFIGATDDPRDVVIVFDLAAGTVQDGSTVGTSGSATVKLDGAGFTARAVTFANDWLRADHPGMSGTQAVACRVKGDRSAFYRCHFLGHQDTLYADSSAVTVAARQYYRHCHIEGDVDFIFGRGTAVFDRCEIHCLERDVTFTPKGMPWAPSTSREFDYGYLATGCRVTSEAGDAEYKLSRPWVPSSNPTAWPALTIRDTWMGPGIDAAEPYTVMSSGHPWQDQRYAEYANIGPGAAIVDPETRPRQLSEDEAAQHTTEVYLEDWKPQDEPDTAAPKTRDFTIFVAGDSTASTYPEFRSPRAGWGQALEVFTGRRVDVDNRAWSGASSKSHTDRGVLDAIAARIDPGDWLLISFGHNDQKLDDPARGTDPYTSYQQYLRGYIDVARQRHANPVLVTSVERRRFKDGKPVETLGEYPEAMRALAEEEGVPLIDLHAASLELWQRLGEEKTQKYFLWLEAGHENYPDGIEDNTHFQARGAIEVARLVAKAAASQGLMKGGLAGVNSHHDEDDMVWPDSIHQPPL
ncbi:MAG TPA: pectinesterase family protein [Glycomyces sp.]|nr:pectinesterase family protein [Glycomyces sp.]